MSHAVHDPIYQEIIELSGQDPALCYQCGKCSAGCPIREYEDSAPNRIIRYIQLGFYDKALTSSTIWLCAGCMTCSTRCPKEYELPRLMDALREIAIKKKIKPAEEKVLKFHKAFLKQIKNNGRAFEFGLVRDYKLSTFDIMQDVDAAPGMFLKGKISLMPHKIKDTKSVKKIFKKSEGDEQ